MRENEKDKKRRRMRELETVNRQAAPRRGRTAEEDTRVEFIRDFVYDNYTSAEAEDLERQHFMIGLPYPYDHVETEDDWMRLEREAAASGVASEAEVSKVFDRWLNW